MLSTALLVGPAATALRITRSPVRAIAVSAALGLAETWIAVVLAYESLLLAALRARVAGELLRRRARAGRLPARPTPVGHAGRCRRAHRTRGPNVCQLMFTGLMANTWIAASIVAVIAGVTGFFAVLRGETFAAHAIPNGAFAGAAGAALLGVNVIWGLAVFAVAGALGIGTLGRKVRHDVVTALALVLMLGVGALFVSWSTEYAQEAYSLLFGEVLGVSRAMRCCPIAGARRGDDRGHRRHRSGRSCCPRRCPRWPRRAACAPAGWSSASWSSWPWPPA